MNVSIRRRRKSDSLSAEEIAVVCQAASILLDYPGDDADKDLSLVREAVSELGDSTSRTHLLGFLAWWGDLPVFERRAAYVETFDLRRHCSLHLTYYTHGDTRDRGEALLMLRRKFRMHGVEMHDRELPDFLPLLLEFVALAPDAIDVLAENRPALELLRRSLLDLESPFAGVLGAVDSLLLSAPPVDEAVLADLVANGPPTEQVGLEGPACQECAQSTTPP